MITLEDATQMGINAPKAHQRVIRLLIAGLSRYYEAGELRLEPFPETMLDESQTSPVPDVLLYDNENEQTPVIIEVTHTTGLKKDIEKVQQLIDSNYYGIIEGFVYNYKRDEWHKRKQGGGTVSASASFSDVLKLDLAILLHPGNKALT